MSLCNCKLPSFAIPIPSLKLPAIPKLPSFGLDVDLPGLPGLPGFAIPIPSLKLPAIPKLPTLSFACPLD